MSADDQQFLDVLSSIPNDIRRYSGDVAQYVEKYVEYVDTAVEKASESIRQSLANSPWIPESIRPRPPPPPPAVVVVPVSTYEKLQDWLWRHKVLAGLVVLTTGAVVYRSYRKSRLCRKTRKAKRARSGGRIEVVVIAGSPALPLTRSLSLDMERKGFIIFVVCNGVEDEAMVHHLSRPDIRPLRMDITDPPSAGASIERFAHYLQSAHAAAPGVKPHHLALRGVVLIPSLSYQTSPIATIPPSSFADLFNTHLLHPILTIQAFLPLLTARLESPSSASSHSSSSEHRPPTPKVLVFTPSIISSINPPFHAPEATVCSAMAAFTEVLAGELRPLGVPVTHVQLGTFDFSGFTPAGGRAARTASPHHQPGLLPAPDYAESLSWPDAARQAYGRNYVSQSASAISAGRIRGLRGSSLRDLHCAVFDVLDGSNTSGAVRVGLGAGLYGFVGRWVPRGLVAWMMGIRRVDELAAWQGMGVDGGSVGSEKSGSENSEYVAVPMEQSAGGGEGQVWSQA